MDSALVVITLASLGTTGAVLLYAARLIRDERTRSNARVTALWPRRSGTSPAGAGRAGGSDAYAAAGGRHSDRQSPARAASGERAPVASRAHRRSARHRSPVVPAAAAMRSQRPRPLPARVPRTTDDGALRAHGRRPRGAVRVRLRRNRPSNRWLVPVIGAVIVVLALATIYFVSGQPDARPPSCARGRRRAECAAGARVAAAGP